MIAGSGSRPLAGFLLLAGSFNIVLIILLTYRESSGILVPGNLGYFYMYVIGKLR